MRNMIGNFEIKWRKKVGALSTMLEEELRCVKMMGSIVFMVVQKLMPKF
ncbi:MAG: hypothetical protein ABIR66_06020 [Saprospiraceae bacterium]